MAKLAVFLLFALAAAVHAQNDPIEEPQITIGEQSVDLVVTSKDAGEQHDEPHWIFLVFQTVPPCDQAAAENGCAGSPRDVAICLAQSPAKLAPECQRDLVQGAMAHDDIDVLTLLANRELTSLVEPPVQEDHPMDEMTMKHHGHDAAVHPIVANLRLTCTTDFQKGVCDFALAKRVCPKRLLGCLAKHKKQLSPACGQSTRREILLAIERENDPLAMACNILASVLFMLIIMFMIVCCCKALARCCAYCCTSTLVASDALEEQYMLAAAAKPMTSEEQELEMALMLSAAEAGKVSLLHHSAEK
jgi:hypothetical protein